MKTQWPVVRLKEILTQDRNYIYSLENREYPKLSVKLYGKGCVVQGAVHGSQVKMKRHQLARAGQLILSEIWGKKGALGFVPPDGEGALITSHFFLFDLDENVIKPDWMKLLIRANFFEEALSSVARGSTGYAAVRPKQFLDLFIPLPPVEQQEHLATVLDIISAQLDSARNLLDECISETQFLRSVVLTKVISQHVTQYKISSLNNVVDFIGGGTPSKKNATYWGGDIPWVTPKDMKVLFIDNSQERITSLGLEEGAAKLIQPEAVLVVFRSRILAHTLPIAVNIKQVTINQDLKALVPKSELTARYLALVLKGKESEILKHVKGGDAAVLSIKSREFARLSVPVPPLEVQQQTVDLEISLREIQRLLESELREFENELLALFLSAQGQAIAGTLKASVPEYLISDFKVRRRTEHENERRLLAIRRAEINNLGGTVMEKVEVNTSSDLTLLLRQLITEKNGRISSKELWQSSGLPSIDTFYAYLKLECRMNKRISERREGYEIYLELRDENQEALDR